MKSIIVFLFAFISTVQAQTYTTAQLSIHFRNQWKTNDSLRKANAALIARLDQKDNKDDLRNIQIRTLNDRQDSINRAVDKMSFNLAGNDFFVDTASRTVYLNEIDDTVIVKKLKLNPLLKKASATGNSIITKGYVDDLKFQISQLEKSVDVRDRIIDKLQKALKKERAKNKLKK